MFHRILDLRPLVARKSVLLLGPRMTGKSTLLRATWPDAVFVDLLHAVAPWSTWSFASSPQPFPTSESKAI